MARSLGVLTIDLVAKTGLFESGMDRASRTAETKMRKIESDAKKLGAALGTAFAAGVTTLAFQIQSSINRMDELSKAAQKVSLPIEQFSALVYAGKLADVEIGTLQTSLGRLTKAQADSLKSTSEQAKIFNALGIAATDASGNLRSSYDVFLDFADAFNRQKGSPEIVAAGLKLFGRSFQELIPLIKDGSQGIRDATEEAAQFGQVISTETRQAAEQFNDNLTRLGSLASGLGNAIAADLLPDLVELTNKFVDSAKEGDALANTAKGVSDIVRVLGGAVEFVIPYFRAIDDVIQGSTIALVGYAEAAKGVINLDWAQIKRGLTVGEEGIREAVLGRDRDTGSSSPASKPLVNLIDPADLLEQDRRLAAQMRIAREEAEKLRKLAFGDEPKDKPTKTGGGAKKSQEAIEAEQLTRAYEGLVEAGRERIALFGQEGEAAKVRYATEEGALKALDQPRKDALLAIYEEIDATKTLNELQEAADDAVRRSTEEYEANVKDNKEFIEGMAWELELLKMTNSQRNEAIALRYLNKDATDEEVQAVKDLAVAQEQAARTAQGWDDAQRALSDSLFDAISGTKSLKDAVTDFFDELSRQILKAITDQWAEQLIGSLSQSGSSAGGAQGGGWMAAVANLFGSLIGGARANGGPVLGGVPYLVGERGPELFVAPKSGSIIPNNEIGMGGVRQVNNFVVQGRIDRRTQEQIAADVGRKSTTALRRNA